jgi:hypothetical protein
LNKIVKVLDKCPIQIGKINDVATESFTLEWTDPPNKKYVTLKNNYGTFVIWDKFMTAETTDMSKIIQIKSNDKGDAPAIDAQNLTGSLSALEVQSYESYTNLNSITDVQIISSKRK